MKLPTYRSPNALNGFVSVILFIVTQVHFHLDFGITNKCSLHSIILCIPFSHCYLLCFFSHSLYYCKANSISILTYFHGLYSLMVLPSIFTQVKFHNQFLYPFFYIQPKIICFSVRFSYLIDKI